MRKESKLVLFYVIYIIATYAVDKSAPSGPCTPGPGFLLFMLFIPISIILFLKDLYNYYREREATRLHCVLIHPIVWLLFILFLNING